ncbi:hypothetical protein QM012_008680 [Aureobasidium pullulans]|uniref:Uncharacterized protein n=1 Tax=Aureobasidium pullulans TaxID=5580 RepID=A0ABR0TIU2_AURPU
MSFSPATQDLQFVKLLAPSTFRQLLPETSASSELPRGKRVDSSQIVDIGHEETDNGPSPQAQPLASIPLIKAVASSVPTDPAARPRIVLKFGKGKKRKHGTTVTSEGNKTEGEEAASVKKARLTQSDGNVTNAKPHLPVEDVAEERKLEVASSEPAAASEVQHAEATNSNTHLTTLAFSDIKFIGSAPSS